MRIRFLILAILVGFGSVAHAGKPNVLVVLVDDMGYGDAGCYNAHSKIETPHIDRLAAEGMRFTDAHAPGPLCHLSRYGLLTGAYPFRTDVSVWREQPVIGEDEETIATLLSRGGYETAMVGKWHLGFDESGGYEGPMPGGPVDRGFDSYFGIRASTDIPPYFYIRGREVVQPPTDRIGANRTEGWSPIQGRFWRAGGIAPDLELEDVLPRFTDEAVDRLDGLGKSEDPFFLYLAYPAPHTPWLPSQEFRGVSEAGLYGDFMSMVDAEIGRVLTALEESGEAEDTLVIFTSDNGPVWYDEDVERLGHDSARGFRGMKADAWEAGHRMPFVVRWPDEVEAGSKTDRMIGFTDIMATLAGITGIEPREGAGPDSVSFLPTLRGARSAEPRPPLVMRSGGGHMTIRSGKWKLIDGLGSGGFSEPRRVKPGEGDPEGQLYDLAADPSESTNLYREHPDVVARLREEMEAIVNGGGE